MKFIKQYLNLSLCLGVFFLSAGPLHAEEPSQEEPATQKQEIVSADSLSKVLFYLAAMALVGGYLIYSLKRGKWVPGVNKNQKLKVVETHPLGNKQFLLVVQYGTKRMMLSAVPGSINKITDLDPEPADSNQPLAPNAPSATEFKLTQ